jgi:phosphoacetylglucosamine mutase
LSLLPVLLNQTVGDAISNLLAIEFALAYFQYSLQDWIDHTYGPDLYNENVKVHVNDKHVFVPDSKNADRTLLAPKDVQLFIDQQVEQMRVAGKDSRIRAFVRPSGTENFLRIYAEAPLQSTAHDLAYSIANYIHERFEGLGYYR